MPQGPLRFSTPGKSNSENFFFGHFFDLGALCPRCLVTLIGVTPIKGPGPYIFNAIKHINVARQPAAGYYRGTPY